MMRAERKRSRRRVAIGSLADVACAPAATGIPPATSGRPRSYLEYRVLVKREGWEAKEWRARSPKAVRARLGILLSSEPWRYFGKYGRPSGDDPWHCEDGSCGACGGLTVREHCYQVRAQLPTIEWVRVESRRVATSAWTQALSPNVFETGISVGPIALSPQREAVSDDEVPF